MGVPEKHRVGFEMSKYYQHFGGEMMHIIAVAKESDMWYVGPRGIFISETRGGQLKETSSEISSCTGWYEITPEIFRENIQYEEFKFGEMDIKHDIQSRKLDRVKISRFFLRIYKNNQLYLFDLYNHYDEDGIHPNILVNDYNGVFKNINRVLFKSEQTQLEQLLFERM